MDKKLYIITELFPPDETSTAYILGEIANACANEYEVHVICGPEVYDTRKALDVEHPFSLNPSISVHRVKGIGVDKNKATGKALSFLMMSSRLLILAKVLIQVGDKVLLVTNPAPLVPLMSRFRQKRQFELNVLVHDVRKAIVHFRHIEHVVAYPAAEEYGKVEIPPGKGVVP